MSAPALGPCGSRLTPSPKSSNEIQKSCPSMIADHTRSGAESARSTILPPSKATTAGAYEANSSQVTRVERRSDWLPDAMSSNSRTSSATSCGLNEVPISGGLTSWRPAATARPSAAKKGDRLLQRHVSQSRHQQTDFDREHRHRTFSGRRWATRLEGACSTPRTGRADLRPSCCR
jgi:hypothetical protein